MKYFQIIFVNKLGNEKLIFGGCDNTILIYGARMFTICLFIKMSSQQAPENVGSICFSKVNQHRPFIPEYSVNLLYILDSNLPAKKPFIMDFSIQLLLHTFLKNIHT